jgi:hypothetical protein
MNDRERYEHEEIQRARCAIFECPHCKEQREKIARVLNRSLPPLMIREADGSIHSLPPAWQQVPAEDVIAEMDRWVAETNSPTYLNKYMREWFKRKALEMRP